MTKNLSKDKNDEEKVLHILHELAKNEGVTPIEWLKIRIMREAKRSGLIKPVKPSKPQHITEEKPRCVSVDEYVTED